VRFTYEEVKRFDGRTVAHVTPEIVSDLQAMGKLAKLLRAKRFGAGSPRFDFPEPDVISRVRRRPTDIRRAIVWKRIVDQDSCS